MPGGAIRGPAIQSARSYGSPVEPLPVLRHLYLRFCSRSACDHPPGHRIEPLLLTGQAPRVGESALALIDRQQRAYVPAFGIKRDLDDVHWASAWPPRRAGTERGPDRRSSGGGSWRGFWRPRRTRGRKRALAGGMGGAGAATTLQRPAYYRTYGSYQPYSHCQAYSHCSSATADRL